MTVTNNSSTPTESGKVYEAAEELRRIKARVSDLEASLALLDYKGLWADLTGSLDIPATVYHNDEYWVLTEGLTDVTAEEPGVSTKWIQGFSGGISHALTADNAYALGGNAPAYYADASNLTAGLLPQARLAATLDKDISGSAAQLGNQLPSYYLDSANFTGTLSNDRLPAIITKDLQGNVTGNVIGNVFGDLAGNADTATVAGTANSVPWANLTNVPTVFTPDNVVSGSVAIMMETGITESREVTFTYHKVGRTVALTWDGALFTESSTMISSMSLLPTSLRPYNDLSLVNSILNLAPPSTADYLDIITISSLGNVTLRRRKLSRDVSTDPKVLHEHSTVQYAAGQITYMV